MSQPGNPKLCGSCDFVALSDNELDEHCTQTGHKKPGLLQLDLGGSSCEECGRKRGFMATWVSEHLWFWGQWHRCNDCNLWYYHACVSAGLVTNTECRNCGKDLRGGFLRRFF